jgi:hypothetical protein
MRKLKTGVSYLNVKYNCNENKRVVACHLKWGINLNRVPFIEMLNGSVRFDEFLNNYFNLEEWENQETGDIDLYAVSELTGFADCDPRDNFDIELGKKIALTRAQEGAFEQAQVFWNKAEEVMLEAANRFSVISENCDDSHKKCKDHTKELIG